MSDRPPVSPASSASSGWPVHDPVRVALPVVAQAYDPAHPFPAFQQIPFVAPSASASMAPAAAPQPPVQQRPVPGPQRAGVFAWRDPRDERQRRAEVEARVAIVKHTIAIETVARQLVPGLSWPHPGSRSVRALCPLHAERTPSFHVFLPTNTWWCFGCQRGGDLIALVQQVGNLSFMEALRWLEGGAGHEDHQDQHDHRPGAGSRATPGATQAPRANALAPTLAITRRTGGVPPSLAFARQQAAEQERQRLARLDVVRRSPEGRALLQLTAEVYAQEIWDTPAAQRFLAARGITEEEAVAHRIGYASGTRLIPALQRARLSLHVALTLGVVRRDRQGRLSEWLRGRLIYLEARQGQPVWMTGRWLEIAPPPVSGMFGASVPGVGPLRAPTVGVGGSHDPGQTAPSRPISSLDGVHCVAGVVAGVSGGSPPATPPSTPPKYLSLPLPRRLGGAEAIWGHRRVVVVEGKTDQVALVRWGYPTCWVGGGSPPTDFLPWAQAAQQVYVAGDGDAGGHALLEQMRRLIPDRCYPVLLPAGLDPCDLACRPDGQRLFQQAILAAPARRPPFS